MKGNIVKTRGLFRKMEVIKNIGLKSVIATALVAGKGADTAALRARVLREDGRTREANIIGLPEVLFNLGAHLTEL